ncbi:MFS transporter [Pseudoroseicyclus aestuarii]|uniref:EmrB/QacA subfamily drug resistance transporter n=1 Tax=Pseudoroseicyclus aestuarii TaxID=1795041 RepID=A0A318SYE2_9RHOB|nr:MFS transporter [Pseudoroseicyclus aestuarii]PYE85429.1 EmrB/QacA subfamily drug resistance transporter [Pseudoroseicyclus aestuarii]
MTEDERTAASAGRWIALAALLVAAFMNLIDVTIVNVALPTMEESLGATASQIEWVVAAYVLTFALCLLPAGRLGDVFGRRRMFLGGVMVFTLGSLLCGLAPGMYALIGARVVQGVGGAMMMPQTLAIIPALFSQQERGTAFALFGVATGLAAVTGPVLGGALIGADIAGLDWRPIFLVNIPVGVLAILAALRFVPALPGEADLKIDFIGIGLAALALLLILFPLIEGRQIGWPLWCWAMLVCAAPAFALLRWWLARQARLGWAQLVPESLLRNPSYMTGTGLTVLLFSGMPGFFLVFAIVLQTGNGLTPLQSGLTTLPFPIGVMTASAIAGRLGTRMPRLRVCLGALGLSCGMIALRTVLPEMPGELSRAAFIPPLLLAGLGLGTAISPLFQIVLGHVGGANTGSASGALQAFQQVGAALGIAVMGELFFSTVMRLAPQGGGEAPAAYSDALSAALWYNSMVFLALALLVWRLPRPDLGGTARPGAPAQA